MTLEQRLAALVNAIGADIGDILASIGDISELPTSDKASLVAALTELYDEVQTLASSGGAVIDDNATSSTTATYSANKINTLITTAINTLVDGAPTALNTLLELANELTTQDAALDNLLTAVGTTVRFTQNQGLTTTQQGYARVNIAAASAAELDALEAAVGNTDADLVAIYTAAKA